MSEFIQVGLIVFLCGRQLPVTGTPWAVPGLRTHRSVGTVLDLGIGLCGILMDAYSIFPHLPFPDSHSPFPTSTFHFLRVYLMVTKIIILFPFPIPHFPFPVSNFSFPFSIFISNIPFCNSSNSTAPLFTSRFQYHDCHFQTGAFVFQELVRAARFRQRAESSILPRNSTVFG